MASALHVEDFECIADCPICQSVLTDPRTQECGHTFCYNCLHRWYESHFNESGKSELRCPTCNHVTAISLDDLPTLPKCFVINEFVEKLQRHVSVSSACQLCRKVDTSFFCRSCDKMFCDKCNDRHGSLFSSHPVVRLCDSDKKFVGCSRHKHEPLKYFCTTCLQLICTMCALDNSEGVDHSEHKVVTLEEAVEYCKSRLKKEEPYLTASLNKSKALLEEARKMAALTSNTATNAKDAIRFFADDLIAQIHQWERNALNKLETDDKACSKEWEDLNQKLTQEASKICNLLLAIDKFEKDPDPPVTTCAYTLRKLQELKSSSELSLEISGPVLKAKNSTCFKQELKDVLGQVTCYERSHFTKRVQVQGPNTYDHVIISIKPRKIWEFANYGSSLDCIRSPVSVSFSDNNDVLISEVDNRRVSIFAYNKDKARSPSTVFVRKCTITCDLQPKAAITVKGSDSNIYVADARTNSIVVFTTNGEKLTLWGEGTFGSPRCITLGLTGKIIVGDSKCCKIFIFNPNGELLRSIGSKGDGIDQFKCVVGVALDSQGRLLVADRELNKVKIFDTDGAFLFDIEPMCEDGYVKPRYSLQLAAVAVDKHDNIYVAIYNKSAILRYNSQGRPLLPFPYLSMADGISYPSGVAVSDNGLIGIVESSNAQKHSALLVYRAT